MRLSELKVGDEVYYRGEPHIAFLDSHKTSTTGEMTTWATVSLRSTSQAALREDGILEFGDKGASGEHVPDEDVPLLRSGIEFHSSVYRSVKREDGSLACEKTNYTTADGARSELRRQTLRRDTHRREMQAEEAGSTEAMFRRAVKTSLSAGVSVQEIKEQTGLSRERIYQIRDGRR